MEFLRVIPSFSIITISCVKNFNFILKYYEKARLRVFMIFYEFLWLYKARKWFICQENDLLGKKEQNRQNFYVGQSLTKNADGWPKSQLLTSRVKTWRESQRLTEKSMADEKAEDWPQKVKEKGCTIKQVTVRNCTV